MNLVKNNMKVIKIRTNYFLDVLKTDCNITKDLKSILKISLELSLETYRKVKLEIFLKTL